MKVILVGKDWKGHNVLSQATINRVWSEARGSLLPMLKTMMSESDPQTSAKIKALLTVMRQVAAKVYNDHAEFYVAYGAFMASVRIVTEQYWRRRLAVSTPKFQELDNVQP